MSVTPETVKESLNSEDLGIRLKAVNQIRQLAEPAIAFELLKTVINDRNARIRYAAVSQMDTLGGQDLATTFNLLRDRLLNDPEPDVQAAAADSLGALQLTEAYEDLQQLYHATPEWLVKFSIIASLGELGEPRSLELLEEALNTGNDLVRTAAISSLGELGDRQAIPLLVPYTTNPDWQIRYRVVQALDRLGGAEVREALLTLANDEMEPVAQEAKAALEKGTGQGG